MQYFQPNGGSENTNQRVTYSYDGSYPCTLTAGEPLTAPNSTYSAGRLSGVTFGGGVTDAYQDSYCYQYAYNQAGRVITQEMTVNAQGYGRYNSIGFAASYQWDDEGRMTSLQYPTVYAAGSFGDMPVSMPIAAFQYDANGRLKYVTLYRAIQKRAAISRRRSWVGKSPLGTQLFRGQGKDFNGYR